MNRRGGFDNNQNTNEIIEDQYPQSNRSRYYLLAFIICVTSFFYFNAHQIFSQSQQKMDSLDDFEMEKLPIFEVPKWVNQAKQGDIFEANNGEFMVYAGQIGSKFYVLKSKGSSNLDIQKNNYQPPSFIEKYFTGYTRFEHKGFGNNNEQQNIGWNDHGFNSENSNHELHAQDDESSDLKMIKIIQLPVENIDWTNGKTQNFSKIGLPPNSPSAILDRAMFKYMNPEAPPHFQNSKDWAIWCRYGKDILTRPIKIHSKLAIFLASGGI